MNRQLRKPYKKNHAKASVAVPYRAVICGEEHIVQGWKGQNLLTDKGEFIFSRLNGKQVESEWTGAFPGGLPNDYPIQSAKLLEVATIQADGNGGWLLNGANLRLLQFLPAGCRLADINRSEVLRVHKDEIQAIAWVQAISNGSITSQLDTVLSDWKRAEQFDTTNSALVMPESFFRNLFAGWSKPIWLNEFHGVNTNPWTEGLSKVLGAKTEPVSVADMMAKGINPFLAGLKIVPVQPASTAVEHVEQAQSDGTEERIKHDKTTAKLLETTEKLHSAQAASNSTLKEALSKWMRFDPPGMKTDTKARIEKAVKLYLNEAEKRSLRKIAAEFSVTPKTVSTWFSTFTKHTGYTVVIFRHHESVTNHLKTESGRQEEK